MLFLNLVLQAAIQNHSLFHLPIPFVFWWQANRETVRCIDIQILLLSYLNTMILLKSK
jgi:hypothetical protein